MSNIKIFAFADEASPNMDGQITAIKRNCLDGLEIRNVDGENISDITPEKAREVKDKLDANGLVTWSIGSPIGKIGVGDDFAPHLEKFKHTLESAEILEAKNIRIFSFYIPQAEDPAPYKNEVIERFGRFVETAKCSGIDLCHENEKGIYGDTPERCLQIFKALPEIKGIFDPANFVQCGVDTLGAWNLLQDYIKYLHIKDAQQDGNVVPAGEGAGNLAAIVKAYATKGGNALTLEPHLAVFDGLAELEREGEVSGIGKHRFMSNDEAFDYACAALNKLLI